MDTVQKEGREGKRSKIMGEGRNTDRLTDTVNTRGDGKMKELRKCRNCSAFGVYSNFDNSQIRGTERAAAMSVS